MKVISQPWGGLGDNLQFSTLAEEYSKRGHDVYMHTGNAYRNPQTKRLMDCNPFLKGYTDEAPNIGSCMPICNPNNIECHNFVSKIELSHLGTIVNKYPKIYYTPKLIPELKSQVVIDQNSISTAKYMDINTDNAIYLNAPEKANNLDIVDIFSYCDIIFSAGQFLCSFSGSMVLASAIKHHFQNELPVICYVNYYNYQAFILPKSLYYFDNVQYIGLQ